ncbi:MAG: hypothetical protein ACTSUE_19260 [Promethearchaeota archaeon]
MESKNKTISENERLEEIAPISIHQKVLDVIIVAFLFGFGWHIRGSGTSDPSVVMLLFLLYVGHRYAPRDKFNVVLFGFIIIIFRLSRRGWGTFVGQAGIPWLWDGHLASSTEGFDVTVAWWQGYFWLFMVGLAWAGPVATIIGGYFLTEKKYDLKDVIIFTSLYFLGAIAGYLIAYFLIPIISPEAYWDVYIAEGSSRNYQSMIDNFSLSCAMIPVLLYVWLKKKDRGFVKRTLYVMMIFGIAFSVADIWQVLDRNIVDFPYPGWSMWEYTTGFIIGGLMMVLYHRTPVKRWKETGRGHGIFQQGKTFEGPDFKFFDDYESQGLFFKIVFPLNGKTMYYWYGFVFMFLYGLQESIIGMVKTTANALGVTDVSIFGIEINTVLGFIGIIIISYPIYHVFKNTEWGKRFERKSFDDKCLTWLISLLVVYYCCYALQFIVTGNLFNLDGSYLATHADTLSVIIVETFLVVGFVKKMTCNSRKREPRS